MKNPLRKITRTATSALALTLVFSALAGGAAQAASSNDSFSGAVALNGATASHGPDTNVGATKEVGEPKHADIPGGASVWYSWTAADDGVTAVSVLDADFCHAVAVYTGSSVALLTPVASDYSCAKAKASFAAVSGTTYRIAVDQTYFGPGTFTLSLKQFVIPANDAFAAATALSGVNTVRIGENNVGATEEVGEPNHAGAVGQGSVWYAWTAPKDGKGNVGIIKADFCFAIGVYTGSSVNMLAPVASAMHCSRAKASFTAKAGTTYLIAVDAYSYMGQGTYNLHVNESSAR